MSCWNNDLMTKDPQPHGPFLDLFSFCCKPKRFPHDPRDPCGFRKGFDTKKATRWCFCTLCKRYSYTRNWAKLAIHCLANLETEMKVRRFVPKYIYVYTHIYIYIRICISGKKSQRWFHQPVLSSAARWRSSRWAPWHKQRCWGVEQIQLAFIQLCMKPITRPCFRV